VPQSGALPPRILCQNGVLKTIPIFVKIIRKKIYNFQGVRSGIVLLTVAVFEVGFLPATDRKNAAQHAVRRNK
jgi:hypothetical protein